MLVLLRRLSSVEPWLVSALSLASLAYEPLLPYAVAGALLFRLLGWLGGHPLRRASFHLPLLLLLAMVAVSAWVTPLPRVTAQDSLRLLMGVMVLLSLEASLVSRRALGWALGGLAVLSAALAVAALLFTVWADKFRFIPALAGLLPPLPTGLDTDMNPNIIGGILAILLAGLLGWLIFYYGKMSWFLRIVLGLVCALLALVLFLTQSRTALLALAAAIGLLMLLRWRRGWMIAVLGIAVGMGLLFYIGPQQVWYSLGGETGGVATFSGREQIWLRAKLLIADFPLTGVGMGTFGEVIDTFYPLAPQPVHVGHAHNLYLQIAADLGLPGLAAWLVCFFTVIWMAWQLFITKNSFFRALGAAVLCSQVALGVNGLLDAPAWDSRPALIIWAIWGLTTAAWVLASQAHIEKSPETSTTSSMKPI